MRRYRSYTPRAATGYWSFPLRTLFWRAVQTAGQGWHRSAGGYQTLSPRRNPWWNNRNGWKHKQSQTDYIQWLKTQMCMKLLTNETITFQSWQYYLILRVHINKLNIAKYSNSDQETENCRSEKVIWLVFLKKFFSPAWSSKCAWVRTFSFHFNRPVPNCIKYFLDLQGNSDQPGISNENNCNAKPNWPE